MLASLGAQLSGVFRRLVPDPLVLAVLLTLVVFGWAWAATGSGADELVGAWQGGLWNLLAFSMQMCLILVTGHALALSRPARAALGGLADLPGSARQGVALTAAVAMGAGLINWGFGLIVGAILARTVADRLASRGVAPPRGVLAAAGYMGMLVWHGGLSGSAPLKASSAEGQAEVLGEPLAASIGEIAMRESVLSVTNAVTTAGIAAIALVLLVLMCPKSGGGVDAGPGADVGARGSASARRGEEADERVPDGGEAVGVLPRLLGGTFVLPLVIAGAAGWWLFGSFAERGFDALTLNSAILIFLTLGLALHGSLDSYGRAIDEAVRGCSGIILQFPLYAGIMGMMTGSGLAEDVSGRFVRLAGESEGLLATLTFVSAGVVNLFVPSGGGQWAVQGPIAMEAARVTGADPARLLLAVSYGDQLTNMLQPFWALPLLAITRAKAGEVVGYTAVVMVGAAVWIVGCLVLLP